MAEFNPLRDVMQGYQFGANIEENRQQSLLRQAQTHKIQQGLMAEQATQKIADLTLRTRDRSLLGKLYGLNPGVAEHVEKSLDNNELEQAKGLQYIEGLPIQERDAAYKVWRGSSGDDQAPDDYNKDFVKLKINSARGLQRDYEKLETAQGVKLLDTKTGQITDTGLSSYKAHGYGGVTMEIVNALKKENPKLSTRDALLVVQGGDKKGITYDEEGNITNVKGFTDAVGNIKSAEAQGSATGKDFGEKQASLKSQEAKMPGLKLAVNRLSSLGKAATYTTKGRVVNNVRRELGIPVGEGAVSRAEYISAVDNIIFPLLKDTFGNQFTKAEGDSLRESLGDPNKSPEEKEAIMNSFILQKEENIKSLRREVKPANSSSSSNKKSDTLTLEDYNKKYGL